MECVLGVSNLWGAAGGGEKLEAAALTEPTDCIWAAASEDFLPCGLH